MNKRLVYTVFVGACLCLCFVQMASAVTLTVAARDASSTVRASANYVCDGTSDNVQIMQAINALPSSGGTVILSSGTFSISDTVRPRSHVTLQGQGMDATILKLQGGSIAVTNPYVTLANFQFTGSNNLYIMASHITLNSVKAYNLDKSRSSAFRITPNNGVEDVVFNDCKAIDCDRFGFLGMVDGGYEASGYMKNIRFNRCIASRSGYYEGYTTSSGRYGSGFDFCENCRAIDITYTDCVAEYSWESGFHNEPAHSKAYSTNVTYIRCIARNNGQIYFKGGVANPTFAAGFMPVGGQTYIDCVAEDNFRGYLCNDVGGKLIRCKDIDSKYGFIILLTTTGYTLTGCSASGQHPVEFWGGGVKATIDGMTITAPSASTNAGILIKGGASNPSAITVKNSYIKGFKTGIQNSASSKGKPTVSNVYVQGATTQFVGCNVVQVATSIPVQTMASSTTSTVAELITTTTPSTVTSTSSSTATGKPDLVVAGVSWSPSSPTTGNAITFRATIKNQGTVASPANVLHGVAFLVDGQKVAWSAQYKASIPAGASVTVTANNGPSGLATWSAVRGAHTLTAFVDDVDRIAEANENNNKMTASFTVA